MYRWDWWGLILNPSVVPMACHLQVTAWTAKSLMNFTLHFLLFLPCWLVPHLFASIVFVVCLFVSVFCNHPHVCFPFFLLPGDQWSLVVLGKWTCLRLTQTSLALNQSTPLTSSLTLGQLQNLFKPQLSHLQNGNDKNAQLYRFAGKSNTIKEYN